MNVLIKPFRQLLIIIALIIVAGQPTQAADNENGHDNNKKVDPAEIILGHIVDSHEWHIITTPGGKHISIYLPVILYSEHSGWHVFSSKHISHGHTYKGFYVVQEGNKKGSIAKELPSGDVYYPYDLSITKNVFSIFISLILLLVVFISVANKYKEAPKSAPSGLQNALEPLILFVRDDIAKSSIGPKYERFMPFLLTVFFFILFNNLMGLIPIPPGGANVTGNLTVTLALALMTFLMTNFSGNKHYWKHIFNTPGVPWWLKVPIPLMPIVEFVQIFIKPAVLAIRLFANILAGHMIVLGFFSLIFIMGAMHVVAGYGVSVVSVAFTIFMTVLEILVAFIQAYVFTMLSALYFGMAVVDEH